MNQKTPKRYLLTLHLIVLLTCLVSFSYAQQFGWAHSLDVGDYARGRAVAVDANGYVYFASELSDQADMDPGPGTFMIGPVLPATNATVIAKYDSLGQFIWAGSLNGDAQVWGMDLDPSGNVCIGGMFQNTVDFDPGSGAYNLTSNGNFDVFTLKLTSSGNFVWAGAQGGPNLDILAQLRVDPAGNIITTGEYRNAADFDPGPGVFTLNTNGSHRNTFISKITPNGTLDWAKTFASSQNNYTLNAEVDQLGNIYIPGIFEGTTDFDPGPGVNSLTPALNTGYFVKLDPQGNLVSVIDFPGTASAYIVDVAVSPTGASYLAGRIYGATADVDPGPGTVSLSPVTGESSFVLKLDAQGDYVSVIHFDNAIGKLEGDQIEVTPQGEVFYAGIISDSFDVDPGPATHMITPVGYQDHFVVKLDSIGNFLWAGQFESTATTELFDMKADPNHGLYFAGYYEFDIDLDPSLSIQTETSSGWSESFLTKMKISPYNNLVEGLVYYDENQNCIHDQGEQGLGGVMIQLLPTNQYTLTAPDGTYAFEPDTGNWTLSVVLPGPTWVPLCPATGTHNVSLVPNDSIAGKDFALDNLDCPTMTVHLSGSTIRPGRPATYAVTWCNVGGVAADSAYIEFTNLHPYFTPTAASLNWRLPQSGNTYFFDLDSVDVMECGTFYIYGNVDSAAILGQALCAEAHIYPDSFCLPPDPLWDGAHVELTATCDTLQDSVRFHIENVSPNHMSGIGGLVVLEDDVLIKQDSVVLPAGQDTTIRFKADGSTWLMRVQQTPFHPGFSYPTAFMEGCGTDTGGNFSIGFVTQYPKDDQDLFRDVYCDEIVTSYDPNDKRGFPTGFYAANEIETNQPLDYVIRFQNTGNDTAFKIVVRDTLDPTTLDIRSFRQGAASHPYTFRLYGQGIAEWTFDNILLPDSNVNLEGSQGFLSFTMDQLPNNPVGTRIENSADIYFDYNDPVLTNTAWHTIGGTLIEFIEIDLIEDTLNSLPPEKRIQVKAFPNPFTDYFTVQVDHKHFEHLELVLFDATGKTVKVAQVRHTNQIRVLREGLRSGMYLYQLKGEGEILSTGKLILR